MKIFCASISRLIFWQTSLHFSTKMDILFAKNFVQITTCSSFILFQIINFSLGSGIINIIKDMYRKE